jgi:hypothetical protein
MTLRVVLYSFMAHGSRNRFATGVFALAFSLPAPLPHHPVGPKHATGVEDQAQRSAQSTDATGTAHPPLRRRLDRLARMSNQMGKGA